MQDAQAKAMDMHTSSDSTIAKGFKQLARTGINELNLKPYSPTLTAVAINTNIASSFIPTNQRSPNEDFSNRAKYIASSP